MTDIEKLAKVRAEIERRKKLHEDSLVNPINVGFGLQKVINAKISELTYFLSFIDSMQEEPASEDLKKEFDDIYYQLGKEYSQDTGLGGFYQGYNFSLKIARHFANWQKTKDESTTEDLGEYINELSKQFPEVSFAKLSRIAVRVAKWQKQRDNIPQELVDAFWEFQKVGDDAVRDFINAVNGYNYNKSISKDLEEAANNCYYRNHAKARESFIEGAQWQKEQDQSTIELAEDHAMLAGMEKMKEQMMAKAVDVTIAMPYPSIDGIFTQLVDSKEVLPFGNNIKVLVIKEG